MLLGDVGMGTTGNALRTGRGTGVLCLEDPRTQALPVVSSSDVAQWVLAGEKMQAGRG